MAEEYGRLPLLLPVPLKNGIEAHEIVIYRPTCRALAEVLDTVRLGPQIERFVANCCKAVNGTGEAYEFNGQDLSSVDGSELAAVIGAMSEEADGVKLSDDLGDGISQPLIYTLKRPIKMSEKDDAETVLQLEFQARRVGEISDFLDARGETKEFAAFMRAFGRPLGLKIPIMTDILIGSLDFLDYLVIRRQIMGKFITSRNRWKKVSSSVH